MKLVRVEMLSLLTVLLCSLFSPAQQSMATAASGMVPPLIQFSNVATDEGGNTLSGVVNLTFSLYSNPQGGEPLWTETQNNVQLDPTGHYSVQLGITKPNGVPTALFTTGEARWLGVQIAEQAEQPRVLLLSVPYALKAGDAATIGGLPPSAFVLAAPVTVSSAAESATTASAASGVNPNVGGTGTTDYIPLWTDSAGDLGNSVLFQSGTLTTPKVGIGTTTPATTLDVKGAGTIRGQLSVLGTLALPATGAATATAGKNSQPLNLAASAYNSSTPAAVNQTFQLQAEPAGNNTSTPSGTLNLLFGSGTKKPAETGLNIASNGQITFATGQTFPGAGTITGITTATGSGLTGGATSGTLNLGLLTTCATNNVLEWNGSAWVCATVGGGGGSGTVTSVATGLGLKGGPITTSGTLTIDTTVVPQLGAANTFVGNQTVTGNVIATTGYEIQFAGTNYLFDYGSPFTGSGKGNSYLGFAGNATTTGQGNVGAGWAALGVNLTGADNTAVGVSALSANSSGQQNTAVGFDALFANGSGSSSTGNANTAIGYGAAYMNSTGYNNTAIGAQALYNNTGGLGNTAIGSGSLFNNTTTGNYNTAIGYQAGPTTNLINSTAIGYAASVSESNALVLGGTGANAVKVGIGTAAPAFTLDAAGTIRSSKGGFMFPDGTTQTTAASAGGGTITGVTAGTGLTGGGTSGNVTLSINTATIPQLSAANAFTGNQTVNGIFSATSSAFGVIGTATATSSLGIGVAGTAATPTGYGVEGMNTSTSGGVGVYGTTASTTGYGVEGLNTSTSGTGVYGTAAQYGVQGVATGSGTGVYGSGAVGVQGAGTAFGVFATGTAAGSTGVYGFTTGEATGSTGVYGFTSAGSTGIYGGYQSPSQIGSILGLYGEAVWADTSVSLDVDNSFNGALFATADNNRAAAFLNNSSKYTTTVFSNAGGGGTGDIVHAVGSAGSCTLTGAGDAACTGVLKSVVATAGGAGAQRVETYAMQSAENWFEDAGTAQLVNGSGRVNLESVFGQTVNTGVEYHVFLTPDGDCKGLYVSAKTASGFEVRELGGGTSNVAFEYRIMAKRVGYENVRLVDATDRFNQQRAQDEKMRHPTGPPAAPQSRPQMPTPPVQPVRAAVRPVAAQPK